MHQVMTRPDALDGVLARAAHAQHARQIARDGRLLGDDELHGGLSLPVLGRRARGVPSSIRFFAPRARRHYAGPMDKRFLIEQLSDKLRESAHVARKAGQAAAEEARDGATAAEKRENARVAQEYAGLARGQAARASRTMAELSTLKRSAPVLYPKARPSRSAPSSRSRRTAKAWAARSSSRPWARASS